MGELTILFGFIFGLVLTIAWIAIPFILISINKKAQRLLNGLQIMEQQLRNIKNNVSDSKDTHDKTD
jgi:predicted PurR-regulated permease PerM